MSSDRTDGLGGARVLLTRAGGRYADTLAACGATVAAVAVTHVEAPADGGAALAAAVAARAHGWVLLTSANAAARFADALAAAGALDPGGTPARVVCVGAATAEVAAARGLDVAAVGDAGGEAAARVLLAAAGPRPRVLFPRAAGGRDEAIDALRAAGAEVALVDAYRTVRAAPGEPDIAAAVAALHAGAIDAVACFAPSQVAALVALAGVAALARPARVAIGATTAEAFAAAGLAATAIAATPDPAALADAVAAALALTPDRDRT